MTKYKPTITDYETRHGIAKLERDGFSREQIMKGMYKQTEGMPQEKRIELVTKLFDRSEK
tara:strand:+ start:819 stop:998 length:180 start_codon:yes stop_codon:yes gene_type:complete